MNGRDGAATASIPAPSLATLATRDNLQRAWIQVRNNRGAPGSDGLTIPSFAAHLDQHLDTIRHNLLAGRYRPSPLRALDRPKPDGSGVRTLGIPTVQDRVVLQAIAQVLTPLWEPTFSPYSFAYRPGRSALDAVLLAQERLQSGHHWIVDLDIEKFFDRVEHLQLMLRLGQRMTDGRLLDLIADFLRAGLNRDGVVRPTTVGIAQGSPLSPLLANIVLDELDQQYQALGCSFVRYADDCILLARTEAEARALLDFTRGFLEDRLKLRLHPTKTRIVQPADTSFLGFTYRLSRYGQVSRRITSDAFQAFRRRIKALTQAREQQPFEATLEAVATFFRGWAGYYRLTQDRALRAAHHFACDALRAAAWRHWETPQERLRQLLRLGIPRQDAVAAVVRLDFPGPEDDPPLLRRALPDPFFIARGLVIPPPPLSEPAQSDPQPLSRALDRSVGRSTTPPAPPGQTDAPVENPISEPQQHRRVLFAFLARRLRIAPLPWPPGTRRRQANPGTPPLAGPNAP